MYFARDARRTRPTASLDGLVEPGLYAIVALALVEDRAGALLCDVQVRAHRPACPRPVPDATVRRAAQTWGGAYGPDLPYALPDDYDPAEVSMMVPTWQATARHQAAPAVLLKIPLEEMKVDQMKTLAGKMRSQGATKTSAGGGGGTGGSGAPLRRHRLGAAN